MLLYVMRHGPAEDRAPTGRDFDRALTPEGHAAVKRVAAALHASRTAALPRVITSPFLRARETAEAVRAISAGSIALEVRSELGAEEDVPLDLVNEVARAGVDTLLVGHQPIVEELVRRLLGAAPIGLPSGFRTAMIVTLEALPEAAGGNARWRRGAILDPRSAPPEGDR